jgi:hypothetical protein
MTDERRSRTPARVWLEERMNGWGGGMDIAREALLGVGIVAARRRPENANRPRDGGAGGGRPFRIPPSQPRFGGWHDF